VNLHVCLSFNSLVKFVKLLLGNDGGFISMEMRVCHDLHYLKSRNFLNSMYPGVKRQKQSTPFSFFPMTGFSVLTLWDKIHLGNLTVAQLINKLRTFLEAKGSLPSSQEPSTGRYVEQDSCSSHSCSLLLKHSIQYAPHLHVSPKLSLSFRLSYQSSVCIPLQLVSLALIIKVSLV
jgi:hypothetical protein